MAARINLTCPACNKQMVVPEEYAGKKIRCKGCNGVVVVPGGAEKSPAKPTGKVEEKAKPKPSEAIGFADENAEEEPKSYGLVDTGEALPRCPFCAQEMSSMEAIICVHCGYNTRTRTRPERKIVYDQTAGDIFMWRLGAFICLGIAIALITLDAFVIMKRESWFDFLEMEAGKDAPVGTKAYIINPGAFALYITMAIALVTYKLLRYVVKRLIFENRPPERKVEKAKD